MQQLSGFLQQDLRRGLLIVFRNGHSKGVDVLAHLILHEDVLRVGSLSHRRVERCQSIEHSFTLGSGHCLRSIVYGLDQCSMFAAPHQLARQLLSFCHSILKHWLHHIGLKAVIDELEVVPDGPAVACLAGLACDSHSHRFVWVGHDAIGRLRIQSLREGQCRVVHLVRIPASFAVNKWWQVVGIEQRRISDVDIAYRHLLVVDVHQRCLAVVDIDVDRCSARLHVVDLLCRVCIPG